MKKFVTKPDQLGGLIKVARKHKGLTQKQLGALLGIDQRTVSALERNPGSVSTARILQVIVLLDMSLLVELGAE